MSGLILNRRRFLAGAAVVGTSSVLAGCDQFDFLGQRGNRCGRPWSAPMC